MKTSNPISKFATELLLWARWPKISETPDFIGLIFFSLFFLHIAAYSECISPIASKNTPAAIEYGLYSVLVTLLISDTNSTAYPTLIYGLYLPYGPGVGLRGLGWRFLTLTERALKE